MIGPASKSSPPLAPLPLAPLATASLAPALLGLTVGGFALALLLLPQRLLQRPLAEGVIALHIEPQGRLRVWNQPISPAALKALLAAAARKPGTKLRLVPSPQTPWGEVSRLAALFERGDLPLELQLPVPASGPGTGDTTKAAFAAADSGGKPSSGPGANRSR
jgi:hypothetical protein